MSVIDSIQAAGSLFDSLQDYFSQLQRASFNNVNFITRSNSTIVGRRQAEHIYPFRDQPWMEDIGRRARRYHIIGFLIGDDVISQRDSMQAALEYPGPGVLVHPTYGRLSVSVLECSFDEDMTHGRVIEMNMAFEESGLNIYPDIAPSSNLISNPAIGSISAIAADFGLDISSITDVAASTNDALSVVNSYTQSVIGLTEAATSIYYTGVGFVGSVGRFFDTSLGFSPNSITGVYVPQTSVSSSVGSAIIQNTGNLETISLGCDALTQAVSTDLTADTISTAVQNLTATMIGLIASPQSAVNIFTQLNSFEPASGTNTDIASIIQDYLRRTAAIALCQSVENYNFISQNEVESIRSQICNILDNEILIAGDEGHDQTFYALTNLENSVSQYLTKAGASLPDLNTFNNRASIPALTLVYEYYQDLTRTDQLVNFANPVHPAFMPLTFQALSR